MAVAHCVPARRLQQLCYVYALRHSKELEHETNQHPRRTKKHPQTLYNHPLPNRVLLLRKCYGYAFRHYLHFLHDYDLAFQQL